MGMRKMLLTILPALLLVACTNRREEVSSTNNARMEGGPTKTYTITLRKSVQEFGQWHTETEVKTIESTSDSAAYSRGLLVYYAYYTTDKVLTKSNLPSTIKPLGFTVTDNKGNDVTRYLSKKSIEAMNSEMLKIAEEEINK